MNLTLKVWRQENKDTRGEIETYVVSDIPEEASFLEMLDIVNNQIIETGGDPITFDHDCREGICGSCSLTINGIPHGKGHGITSCQLHMRKFSDGETIYIEPFRAKPFPVLKDLMVDRSSFDRIIESGGYVSVRTGSAVDANSIPVEKKDADTSFDAATCIGCGACVASCKNASAMLFVSAKIKHLNSLPQGEPEKTRRVINMVNKMDDEGFGNCTNQYDFEAVCPKSIKAEFISDVNRQYGIASAKEAIK